jgi:hypothetical protein
MIEKVKQLSQVISDEEVVGDILKQLKDKLAKTSFELNSYKDSCKAHKKFLNLFNGCDNTNDSTMEEMFLKWVSELMNVPQ